MPNRGVDSRCHRDRFREANGLARARRQAAGADRTEDRMAGTLENVFPWSPLFL